MSSSESFIRVYEKQNKLRFGSFIARNIHEIIIYRHALANFVKINLRNRYRRSTLGFLWSLINPLFTMVILAFVFSTIYKVPFADFGIYIFSGLLPWQLISNSVINGTMSIIYAEGYLKKVYTPKILFPLVTVSTEAVNFSLSLISLFFLAILLGAKIGISLLMLPVAIILTFIFVLGIVLVVSVATIYFRDLFNIVQVVFTALFYLVPVVYKISIIPSTYQVFYKLNPFFYFIELFHKIIYESVIPSVSQWGICAGMSLITLLIGLFVLNLKEQDLIFRL